MAVSMPAPSLRLLAGAVLPIAVLGGCVSWSDTAYRPSIPEYAKLPFVDQAWATTEALEIKGGKHWPRPLSLNDYKDVLRLILGDIMASLELKNAQTWDNGLTTLLGTTGAAVGALAGKTGLTNTGIGVAAGGQIAQNHYTPEAVRSKHLDAHRKLACISTEIGNLSEFQRQWAMESTSDDGRQAAGESLFTIAHAVDGVLADYRLTLLGMSPPAQTTQDMIRFLEDYKTQAVKADKAASAAGGTSSGKSATVVDPTPTMGVKKPEIPASGSSATTVAEAASAPGGTKIDTMFERAGKLPGESMSDAERQQYVASGNRYAVRFVTLAVRLEACRRLGTP